jgi:hypothetical protein
MQFDVHITESNIIRALDKQKEIIGTYFVLFGEEEIHLIIMMENPQGQQTELRQACFLQLQGK